MMEACVLMRHFPGLGLPWKLTLAQWNGMLDRLADILERENPGDPEDPQAVQRRMALMQRQNRRNQVWERHGNGRSA